MAGGPRAAPAIALTERTRGRGPCISRTQCRTASACSARPNGTVGTSSSVVLNAQDPSGGPYKDVGGGGAARKGQNPDFGGHFHGLGGGARHGKAIAREGLADEPIDEDRGDLPVSGQGSDRRESGVDVADGGRDPSGRPTLCGRERPPRVRSRGAPVSAPSALPHAGPPPAARAAQGPARC